VTTFLLSLIGLGLSIYLTVAHFDTKVTLSCPDTGVVNCQLVTTSAQSYFLGIPVSVLGMCQYVVMTALNSPFAWRLPYRWLAMARFAIAAVGVGFVCWLLVAEFIIIDHICLYCTAVHIVTIALLLVLTRVTPKQLGWANSGEETPAVPLH
jgi:uncharacterized membrane protein